MAEMVQSNKEILDKGMALTKKRILFVDDESNVLQGLRRMLHSQRHEWDMAFAGGGQEALELLSHAPFDVVVSDMRMPGMDGVQLLNEVMARYPHMVRIVLSGHSDREASLKSVQPAHQYLAKPCDAAALRNTITRACALRELLGNAVLQRLVSGMTTLPSLPTLYFEVVEAIEAPDGSLKKIGEIIERDMGMTAKILQLVNSAFFGLQRHVSSPAQAVWLLGLETTKALVLSVQIFTHFDQALVRTLALDTLWQHSMAIGSCARSIARAENCEPKVVDEAFMAGLLHDTGKLILAANLPDQYREALTLTQEQGLPEWEAERATLGATHAEVGAYLLGIWGLPDAIVETVAFHHCPTLCPGQAFSPLTAVHVADALMHEGDAADATEVSTPVDREHLAALDCSDRLDSWRQHCQTVQSEVGRA